MFNPNHLCKLLLLFREISSCNSVGEGDVHLRNPLFQPGMIELLLDFLSEFGPGGIGFVCDVYVDRVILLFFAVL